MCMFIILFLIGISLFSPQACNIFSSEHVYEFAQHSVEVLRFKP